MPGGATSITFETQGAQGGAGCSSGGLGGDAWTTVSATYGQQFTLEVGGQGTHGGGFDGGGGGGASPGWPIYQCPSPGGGGGASDVRSGGTDLGSRILVAGGGGGGSDAAGGAGGGTTGVSGGSNTYAGAGGGGGTQSAGGGGGSGFWSAGGGGALGGGGGGGGTGGAPGSGGGGGGGGYYGGGGGGADSYGGGGGGGSSYGPVGTPFTTGTHAGAGQILVSFIPTNVLTVSVSATQVYGGTPTYTAGYSGFTNGDSVADLGGSLSCTSITNSIPVGTSSLSGCGGYTSSKYYIVYVPGTLTVTPAPLTATVTGTQPLGGSPTFTATYTGFVLGQNSSVVSGALSCSTSATAASPVGTGYTISNCSGPSASNYAISYSYGTLTVHQSPRPSPAAPRPPSPWASAGSFTVTSTGNPTPALSESGRPARRRDLHRQRQRHRHPGRHPGRGHRRDLPDHHHRRQRGGARTPPSPSP